MQLAIFIFVSILVKFSSADRVLCYFPSWAKYKPGDQKFQTANVDANICSHIVYAYVGLDENAEIVLYDDWETTVLELDQLNYLKNRNPDLKIFGSIGGWNEASSIFSQVFADPEKRQNFLHSVYNHVGQYELDGIEIDWEYPGLRGGDPEHDAENFVTVLTELNTLLDGVQIMLSIAVSAQEQSMNVSYPDVKAISDNVDLINVIRYDESYEEPSYMDQTPKQQELNIIAGIKRWIDAGADPTKLNVGLNTYGQSVGLDGTVNGILGYNEICQLGSEWEDSWDEVKQTPIKSNGTEKIVYEDVKSLGIKADLIKNISVGGAAVWSLDTDDFHANCDNQFYPLIKTIRDHLA